MKWHENIQVGDREHGPIRILLRALLEQCDGDLFRVQQDDVLAQHARVNDIPCWIIKLTSTSMSFSGAERTIYL